MVSLPTRVAKLEAATDGPNGITQADFDAWVDRAVGMIAAAAKLPGMGRAAALIDFADRHLRFYAYGLANYHVRPHQRDWGHRFPAAVLTLARVVPADMRADVFGPVALNGTHPARPWAKSLILDAAGLSCRIPPDITPDAAVKWLSSHRTPDPTDPPDWLTSVCDECGLSRYGIRGSCFHCGSVAFTWHTRIGESHHPWQSLAADELDSVSP